jgi:hypothetical protein
MLRYARSAFTSRVPAGVSMVIICHKPSSTPFIGTLSQEVKRGEKREKRRREKIKDREKRIRFIRIIR